jgi:hypothetical protein
MQGLPRRAWLGVPCIRAQLGLAPFLHGEAAPGAYPFRQHRQALLLLPPN